MTDCLSSWISREMVVYRSVVVIRLHQDGFTLDGSVLAIHLPYPVGGYGPYNYENMSVMK